MSKKVFQIVSVVLILSVLLTACQSAQTPAPTAAPAPTQAVAAPTQAPAPTQAAAAPKVGGQLNYLGWEGYDDLAAFKPLYDQTGLVLNTTYIGTNDEVITKLKAGGLGTYDVGDINARYLNLMATNGMLMPLDEARLPNLKDLFPAFKEQNYGYIDGKLYAVPAFFGNTSICYRADKVAEPTWDFFMKPEYQGKYAVSSNGLSDTYLWAMALGLGVDATKWTQDDLAKIKARGMEEFKHAATMITGGGGEMTDLLVRGDVVLVTDCWDQVAVNAQKQGVNVKSVTPAGPIKATLDIYFIFAGAKNVDAAYAWLNQAISAEAMAIMAKDYGSAVTNVKAFDLLDAPFKESLHFATLNDTIKRTQFNVMPNPDAKPPQVSLDDIMSAFEEIKTSSSVPAAPKATPAPTQAAAAPKVGGQLNYLGWEGYDDLAAFKPLYDQTGLVLNTTYIGTNDEVITKLKAGGLGTYDVGDINARYLNLMATNGMLMPLDEARLPNLKDLFPAFKEQNYGYIDGKLYAVPAFFGNTSICYRADKVAEPTWDFFMKPEYQGKYAVSSNGLSDTYLWAMALGLGVDATKWTQDDLAKIKARGMEEFKHAATMITGGGGEMTDLLVRGDVVLVTDCWDQVAVNAQKQGVNVKSVTPAGPIKATLDIYFIFAGAKNVDAAYAWLNQAISAEAMAIMAKDYGSAVTNVKAFDLLDAPFKESLHFATLNDTIKRTQFNVMPNPDAKPPQVSLDDITKAFEEIKATVK